MKKTGYKEIFIFIAGSTPQVITETIYALAVKKPPVYPDEIYIITTCMGRARAEELLVGKGILNKLITEYKLPPLELKESSFIIPKDCSGNMLDDIRDEKENESMGDIITSVIRDKTADPACRLHCSIAGGRKTMSFYLGAAMQLFARPWDNLYHVLVSPEFESNPEFFYKPKKDKVITPPILLFTKEGETGKSPLRLRGDLGELNTKNAQITLAELPFIRLRNKISPDSAVFRELVREGQKEIDMAMVQPELRINLAERKIWIGQKAVKMTPLHLMIYTAYMKRKLYHCKYPDRPYCYDCTDCYPTLLDLSTKAALEEMAKDYMKMSISRAEDLLYKYRDGLKHEVLRQAISKIKKLIGDVLKDDALTSYYAITSPRREYFNTRHGVRVEKGKIRIE